MGVSTASDSRDRLLVLELRTFALSAVLVDDAPIPTTFDGGTTSLGSERTALYVFRVSVPFQIINVCKNRIGGA